MSQENREHMSQEDIYYALGELGILFDWGWNSKPLVVEALSILPQEIAKFALDNCSFVMFDKDLYGRALAPHWVRGKYIVLVHRSMSGGYHKQLHTLLHEIAHVVLGHCQNILSPTSPLVMKREETEANRLVAEWMRAAKYRKGGDAAGQEREGKGIQDR